MPRLLGWFAQHARDLPWRRTRDPYAIWVSEIMLQQTQVKTVIPYYERWMASLPDVRSLARASSQRLHKLWEGLGYYTRVRNMQRAAQVICEEHGGRFPWQFDDLFALPGIGRYSAGAICSIAFDQPTPILDGNVIRVLTRLFGIASDPKDANTNARLWQLAEALVSAARQQNPQSSIRRRRSAVPPCSHLNQSLMELGATICTPRNPTCTRCPVARSCVAYRRNLTDVLPFQRARAVTIQERVLAFAIRQGRRYWITRNPREGTRSELWHFPSVEVSGMAGHPANAAKLALPFRAKNLKTLVTFKHSITRYRITLTAFSGTAVSTVNDSSSNGKWATPAEIRRLPFSAAHRTIALSLPAS